MNSYDLVIIGAGPAGLGCAISAVKRKLNILLMDKGNIVNSIINFPVNMTFFSTADLLEIHDIPFNSMNFRPNRTEAVRYYHSLVKHFDIPAETLATVNTVEKNGNNFEVMYTKSGKSKQISSKNVVLATGFFDNANQLNVEGENLGHVSHYYVDPLQHFNQDVVIVGGKNSAVEAALELHRTGARVSIVHRRDEIRESVKYWILPDIQNRIKESSIKVYLNSHVTKITPEFVEIESKNNAKKIPADAVYLLTGYHPEISMLEKIGIQFDQNSLEPRINNTSLESNCRSKCK
ncbi:MAG: YpdA family putative bacillithiol disulfide reductase [Planctomycetota bacterium]|jgi:putative YpdA family bacillithiol system oxidoreductase